MATISGGDKLKSALDGIAKSVTKASTLQVGFLARATYPDGKSVAIIAAIQEFGAASRGIPPRPFFRAMISKHSSEWPGAIGNLLVANNYDADKTLRQTGMAIKGQLAQSIIDTNSPPNAPSTIRRKGGASKVLVDTGHMLNSIDFEVE